MIVCIQSITAEEIAGIIVETREATAAVVWSFFFQAEEGIRAIVRSLGLGGRV